MINNNKLINYIIVVLFVVMIGFKISNNELFLLYNNILCYLCIFIVIVGSIYFTIKLKFLQFNVFKMVKSIKSSSISDVKALFMSMGAKIGVGSIVGISLAIYVSGPGVLLWIWIISLLSSILTYCESYLGCMYKRDDQGGVFYYISRGLNNKRLSIIYTFILIFVYAVGFVGIQSNTIIKSIDHVINIDKYVAVIGLCLFIAMIIFNNIKSIIDFMAKLVPVMCVLYIVFGLFILFNDIDRIIFIFNLILEDGLRFDRAIIGVIIVGLQRGIFATEAGIGTSSIASSISSNDKMGQGIFQVMGVHFISLVIVTITGFIIIGSDYSYVGTVNGVEIIFDIFNHYYGFFGKIGLCIIIILFAISTIVSGYYYSIKGLEFLKGTLSSVGTILIKILVVLLVFMGGVVDSTVIWSVIDTLVLFLLLINIYAIFCLRKFIAV